MKSVSLYIHIPFCRKKCDYCDFYSVGEKDRLGKKNDLSDSYITALVNEIHFYASRYEIAEWATVYVGGGTPSILSPDQLKTLFAGVKHAAPLAPDAEVTVEMNPDDVSEKLIDAAKFCGVNRLSLGIQALDDIPLRKVSRACTALTATSALDLLEKIWDGRLSVDFIAGLPGQTYASFEKQFETIKKYHKIDHVSLYTLTVEEGTPLWKNIQENKIHFSYDKADRMWVRGRNLLKKNGFFQYEVSNFAKVSQESRHESRHNTAYWFSKSYIGCGSGASGTWNEGDKALRWTDSLSIPVYVDFWQNPAVHDADFEKRIPRSVEKLDKETLEFEFLMMGFRTFFGVSGKEYFRRFGESLPEKIGAGNGGLFDAWKKRGLCRSWTCDGETFFSLTERGILLLNRFLEELI